jgi:hypothetical protein
MEGRRVNLAKLLQAFGAMSGPLTDVNAQFGHIPNCQPHTDHHL